MVVGGAPIDTSASAGLTVHRVPRVVVGAGSAAMAVGWRCANPFMTVAGAVGVIAGAVGEMAVGRLFPIRAVRRFADVVAAQASPSQEAVRAAAGQRYRVGFRQVPGEYNGRPHLSVFYPTDVVPSEAEFPNFIPFGDVRYAEGWAAYGSAPRIASRHHTTIPMEMARNAALAADVMPNGECRLASKEHPIILFSHGLAGQQNTYAAYCADLAASGAVVITLQHCDGSACFALEPPPNTKLPPSQQTAIAYKTPPSDPEADHEFRKSQILTRRVPEIRAVLRYIQEGQLHDLLHCPPGAFEASFGKNASKRPVPVSLVGHSFGGATVLAATALHFNATDTSEFEDLRRAITVRSCVALDAWMYPVVKWVPGIAGGIAKRAASMKAAPPAVLFQDSQHWNRWSGNVDEERVAMAAFEAGGCRVARESKDATDHLTLSSMSDLVNLRNMRRKYADIANDRRFVAEWAAEGLEHIRATL